MSVIFFQQPMQCRVDSEEDWETFVTEPLFLQFHLVLKLHALLLGH